MYSIEIIMGNYNHKELNADMNTNQLITYGYNNIKSSFMNNFKSEGHNFLEILNNVEPKHLLSDKTIETLRKLHTDFDTLCHSEVLITILDSNKYIEDYNEALKEINDFKNI